MANHVTTFVFISGNSDLITSLDKKLSSVELEDVLFGEMNTEQTTRLFYENQYENTSQWVIENVGAKWCHINEWVVVSDTELQIQLTSAWSFPEALVEKMYSVCSELDEECEFSITYEDESLDPIGAMYISKDGSHLEESSFEWPEEDDYETEEEYLEASEYMWDEIGNIKDDLLEQCKLIVNESDDEDDEGTDIYTQSDLEELTDWDTTLMDGLDEEEWGDENNL